MTTKYILRENKYLAIICSLVHLLCFEIQSDKTGISFYLNIIYGFLLLAFHTKHSPLSVHSDARWNSGGTKNVNRHTK
jgi:hypothetical protein